MRRKHGPFGKLEWATPSEFFLAKIEVDQNSSFKIVFCSVTAPRRERPTSEKLLNEYDVKNLFSTSQKRCTNFISVLCFSSIEILSLKDEKLTTLENFLVIH